MEGIELEESKHYDNALLNSSQKKLSRLLSTSHDILWQIRDHIESVRHLNYLVVHD